MPRTIRAKIPIRYSPGNGCHANSSMDAALLSVCMKTLFFVGLSKAYVQVEIVDNKLKLFVISTSADVVAA